MTQEEVKQYIQTKITYDILTPNYILSKWYSPEDIEIVKSLQGEIASLYVDETNKRFRLRRKIK